MNKITDWSARRSGAGITVKGKKSDGEEAVLSAVSEIVVHKGRVLALVKDGSHVELAVTN